MPNGFLPNSTLTLSMSTPPNPRKRLLRCALLDFANVVALEAPLPPSPVSPGSPVESPVNLTIPAPPIRVDLPLTPDYYHDMSLQNPIGYNPIPDSFSIAGSPPKKLCTTKFTCKLCSLNFSDPFSLARHVCAAIRPVEYRCPECDKVFNNPANLASHRRWHKPSAQQQLNCPHCSMVFRRNSLLKKHVDSEHTHLQHLRHDLRATAGSQSSGRLHSNLIPHIAGLTHHPESPFIPVPSLH
ncbi:insulinoma-associated protein 1-like [Galendromus occidentalis]|uniref:Insulinoma-associated protein 1-like n=1 Tax=Galendromus occidentalis TaxID=34638 RepID=A0AAJ7PA17_9ACAR|nr:insulinoma-associated protein 1-like [Galendromus occidentalis]